jgi:plastocyanin
MKELRMFLGRRVVGLGILAVALVGCGGSPSASKPPQGVGAPAAKGGAVPKVSPISNPNGELVQIGQVRYANWGVRDAIGDKTRDLDAGDFYFKGTFIRGDPGQKLTLQMNNPAQQVHNISIPEQVLDQDLPPGLDRVNVDVTFPMSGGVQFFCKYHTARGMNGLLLVGDVPPLSVPSPSPSPSPQPAR